MPYTCKHTKPLFKSTTVIETYLRLDTMVKPLKPRPLRRPPRVHKLTKRQHLQLCINMLVTLELLTAACHNAGYRQPRQAAKYMYPELHASGLLGIKKGRGRKRYYSEAMFNTAFNVLTDENPRHTYNKSQLFRRCVPGRAGHSVDGFIRAFRAWLKDTHNATVISTDRAALRIGNDLAKKRLDWCKHILALLKSRVLYLNDIVFMDETSALETEHPKGMYAGKATFRLNRQCIQFTYFSSVC